MPTYEYECRACGHRFEQFQSMKDAALKKCPACKKARLERLIGTGAAILFKGSGFYQTDYRSESYKKAAQAETKPAETKPAESAPANGTAAKPAAESAPPKSDKKPAAKAGGGKSKRP